MIQTLRAIFFICFASLTISSYGQELDTANSFVKFTIFKMGEYEVNGTIKNMSGTLSWEDSTPRFIDLCIDPKTVDTDHAYRDKVLQNEDYFHTATYPSICFKSDSIFKVDGKLMALGELTMLGVTKQESFELAPSTNLLVASTTINREDYGLGGETMFKLSEEVILEVHCILKTE